MTTSSVGTDNRVNMCKTDCPAVGTENGVNKCKVDGSAHFVVVFITNALCYPPISTGVASYHEPSFKSLTINPFL